MDETCCPAPDESSHRRPDFRATVLPPIASWPRWQKPSVTQPDSDCTLSAFKGFLYVR